MKDYSFVLPGEIKFIIQGNNKSLFTGWKGRNYFTIYNLYSGHEFEGNLNNSKDLFRVLFIMQYNKDQFKEFIFKVKY